MSDFNETYRDYDAAGFDEAEEKPRHMTKLENLEAYVLTHLDILVDAEANVHKAVKHLDRAREWYREALQERNDYKKEHSL